MLKILKYMFNCKEVKKPVFQLTNTRDDMFCVGKVRRIDFGSSEVRVIVSRELGNPCNDMNSEFCNVHCTDVDSFAIGEVVAVVNRNCLLKLDTFIHHGLKMHISSKEADKTKYYGMISIGQGGIPRDYPVMVEIDTLMDDKEIYLDINTDGTIDWCKFK